MKHTTSNLARVRPDRTKGQIDIDNQLNTPRRHAQLRSCLIHTRVWGMSEANCHDIRGGVVRSRHADAVLRMNGMREM